MIQNFDKFDNYYYSYLSWGNSNYEFHVNCDWKLLQT